MNWAHLELLPLWIISLHSTRRRDAHHAVHVQVRWQFQYQIFRPESHLQIFQYEHPANWTERTLSYRRSENVYCTASHVGIFVTQCTSKCSNKLCVKFLVPKAICKYFSMKIPHMELSAPWAIAAVKIFTALCLTSEFSLPSARPSAVIISGWNILSRKPSASISGQKRWQLNWAHLELLKLWRFRPRTFWHGDCYHQVHVQV